MDKKLAWVYFFENKQYNKYIKDIYFNVQNICRINKKAGD